MPQVMTQRNLPDAIRESFVGSSAHWRAAGVTAKQMRSLIRSGLLTQVRRGVYATKHAMDIAAKDPSQAHALRVAAVRVAVRVAAGNDVVASHHSAALLHGLDLLKEAPGTVVTLTRSPAKRSRSRVGVLFHAAELPDEHVTRQYGMPVTTVARTVIDLARTFTFMEGVVVADSALHAQMTTKAELARVIDFCGRWPQIEQARQVVAFSNGLAESVLESCARVTFGTFSLESPQLQVNIHSTAFIGRVDFYWAAHRTIAEADGLAKYVEKADILDQFRRDRLLRDAGYKVVHFTWRELFETPEVVIGRIQKAFAALISY
jgi:very-short-patch-repair endonuclease